MRRVHILWLSLAGLYAVFWLWHTPLKGPLSQAEIAQYIERLADRPGASQMDPDQVLAFFSQDDGRPFTMVNLLKYRQVAAYGEDAVGATTDAAEANAAYGRGVVPLMLKRGSYPIMITTHLTTLTNTLTPGAEDFDQVAVVRYRSRRDLLDMVTSEAFLVVNHHKWAALEGTVIAPTQARLALNLGTGVPLGLLIAGALVSLLVRDPLRAT